MINLDEYVKENSGKQVMVSTLTGKIGGILFGSKEDANGKLIAIVLKQYLHRTEIPAEEILNVRLIE